MKEIALTQGKTTMVDDTDFDELSRHKWHYNNGYAVRMSKKVNGKQRHIFMHRVILDTPDGMDSDHINHDMLDNRRENLRTCTHTQNKQNGLSHRGSSSQYKGVSWHKRDKKWEAQIKVDGKVNFLGYFDDEEMAATAYDGIARKVFGEFALLNFNHEGRI